MKKTIKKILSRNKKSELDIFSKEGSKSLYEAAVKNSIAIIFATDINGILILSEGKSLRDIGLKPGQAVGLSVYTLYKDLPEVIDGFNKAFKQGKTNEYVTTVQGVSFLTSIAPIKDSKGKVIGTQGMAVNISKQIEVESQLKIYQNSYQSMFDQANDAIFIHDIKTGEVLNVNQKMLDMYGFTRKEVLSGNIGLISSGVAPYDQAGAGEKVKLAASGKPQIFDWHGKTKKGKLFWVEVSLSKVELNGEDRILASVRDITIRKQYEEQLININQMKNEFISIAAHQLRTPLGAMRWNMELLLSKEGEYQLGSDVKDLLQKTYKSNIKIIHLVNDLLDVSRIDQNKVKIIAEKFNIQKSLESVVEQLEYEIKIRALKVDLRVAKGYRYSVELDKRQFKDVVNNLIHNAIKYSFPKTKIIISLEKKENFFVVKVKNTGIGITQKEQKHIYEKFFRAKNAIKTGSTGSGLGLFIAKSFVESWGGSITFSSKVRETTVFSITIPILNKHINT